MTSTVTIRLREPATEISREEILKQVAHLSGSLQKPRIDGSKLEFEIEASEANSIKPHAERLCAQIQRSLRALERKVVYRTQAMDRPVFRGAASIHDGIFMAGRGQVIIEDLPLKIFHYFDSALAELERQWDPRELLTPTLIPASVLAKCDYFVSFPNTVTFACHLQPEAVALDRFRARHNGKPSVDGEALADMAPPEACLSPAVCYHVIIVTRARRCRKEASFTMSVASVFGTRHRICAS